MHTIVTGLVSALKGERAEKVDLWHLLKAIQASGLRVPEDLSVIAMFNETTSELITPPLSTISFPAREMGYQAASILIGHMTGELSGPRQVLLRPELNIRQSTGPARTAEV